MYKVTVEHQAIERSNYTVTNTVDRAFATADDAVAHALEVWAKPTAKRVRVVAPGGMRWVMER